MIAPTRDLKRVVFLSASAGVWGAEESLLTLARALQDQGHDVALVCLAGPLADRWHVDVGQPALCIEHISNPDASKLQTANRVWRRYFSEAQKDDTVVIFTYYLVVPAAFYRLALATKRIRVALDMHDNLAGGKGRLLLRLFSLTVNRIIAVSNFTAEQFGPFRSRVSVITRPVDHVTTASKTASTITRVGIVGRLIAGKGHELLISAATLLEKPVQIIVRGSGDGSADDNSERVMETGRAALGQRFVYEGPVPRDRVMENLDILVVGNDREPLGRTVIEAQLNNVLTVVPDRGGSSELVVHGVTGLKYAAGNPHSLARALEALMSDQALQTSLLEAARSSAELASSPIRYARSYVLALQQGPTANGKRGVIPVPPGNGSSVNQ